MVGQSRIVEGRVSVEGEDYLWSLRREPQWSAAHKAWVGVVITVEPAEAPQKQLVIEYPMPEDWKPPKGSAPRMSKASIDSSDFANQIAQALEAGWNPASRGKPFIYVAGLGARGR